MLPACVLVLATVAAYSNSFVAGFAFDSKGLIIEDTRVHAATHENVGLILNHTYWWPHGESGLFRPVTTLSYLFNYAILGNADRPAGYHAINLLLHIVNVLLVYVLTRRLAGADEAGRDRHRGPAAAPERQPPVVSGFSRTNASRTNATPLAIAMIWAVHPLCTEAVTNIVGRADLLAACSVLGGFWTYLEMRDARGFRRAAWLAGLALITAIGAFSKESAVVIAGVVVLYEAMWWDSRASATSLMFGLIAIAPPLIVWWIWRAAVLARSLAAEFPFVDNPIIGAGFWIGRFTAIQVMGRYLRLIVWPVDLSCDYSYAQIPLASNAMRTWIASGAMAALAATVVAIFRRHRAAAFALLFAFMTFLPASNLVFPSGTVMAERLMYLPLTGCVAAAVFAVRAALRRSHAPYFTATVFFAVVVALAGRTWVRNVDWRDDVSLWTSAVRTAPLSFKAHRALADALYLGEPGHANLDRVIEEAEKGIAVLSALPDAQSDAMTYRLAATYYLEKGDRLREGRLDAAASPASVNAYERAVPLLLKSLAIIAAAGAAGQTANPLADVYRRLSAAYVRLHDSQQAVEASRHARTLDPFNPVGYRQAAAALLSAERADDAAVALMVGSLLTSNVEVRQQLIDLYRSGLDSERCAVIESGNGATLNPSCPMVRRQICAASTEAVRIQERSGRRDEAERLRRSAAPLNCQDGLN